MQLGYDTDPATVRIITVSYLVRIVIAWKLRFSRINHPDPIKIVVLNAGMFSV